MQILNSATLVNLFTSSNKLKVFLVIAYTYFSVFEFHFLIYFVENKAFKIMQDDKSGNQILPVLRLFVGITISLMVFLRRLY